MRRVNSTVPLAVHSGTARRLKCKRNVQYMRSGCYQLGLIAERVLCVDTDSSLWNYSLVQTVVYFPRIISLFKYSCALDKRVIVVRLCAGLVLMFADNLVKRREGQGAKVKGARQNGPVRCKTGANAE
jgi:hypothetical protein